MRKRDGDFTGTAQHDDQYKTFWVRTVASGAKPAGAAVEHAPRPLYELVYNTESQMLPRQMDDIRGTLTKSFRIME
jgi:hypothetical protein